MKQSYKIAASIAIVFTFLWGVQSVAASILQGFQGGTGYGSATTSNVGQALIVASTSPYLTYTFGAVGSGGVNGTGTALNFPYWTSTSTLSPTSSLYFSNGYVGIGTTNPITPLMVNGVIQGGSQSATAGTVLLQANYNTLPAQALITQYSTGGIGLANFMYQNGSSTWLSSFNTGPQGRSALIVANNTLNYLQAPIQSVSSTLPLTTQPTSVFYINGSGHVGINTTAPTNSLTVAGNANITGSITASTAQFSGISNTGNITSTTETVTTSTIQNLVLPNILNSFLATDGSGNVIATTTPSGGGSSVGSAGKIQFASSTAGAFDATSTFTFTSSTNTLYAGGVYLKGGAPTVSGGGGTISQTFSYSGAISSFSLPSNVTGTVVINAIGAGGGASGSTQPGSPGAGGSATGTLSLASSSAGTLYYFNIGGTNGYNGGGTGNGGSGNGGGATWVSTASSFSTSTGVLIAAGGGGAGHGTLSPSYPGGIGGAGGGLTGFDGTKPAGETGNPGGGATQSAGGTATANATAGSFLQGGNGDANGSGGGGGLYGGGGGQGTDSNLDGQTGGGGSSWLSSNLTSTSTAASSNTSDGSLEITYSVTGPIIVGSNTAGKVTVANSMTTSTITFSGGGFTPSTGVSCLVSPNNATNTWYVTPIGTTAFTVTFQNALTAGQSFNYQCFGY